MELPNSIEFAGITWTLSGDHYIRSGNQGPCAHLKFEEEGSGQRAVVETAACRLEGDWAFTIWGALVELQRSGRVIWK